MPSKKLNLRDRVQDNQLDLSMSDLDEVPVREIAQIKMATFLDLSNNRLTSLGANFASLTHLVKLDLSKNQLTELPSNFGDLVLLKHLDLYSNKIQHLPLSLSQLSNLRWLDLKDNPLVPALAEVVGPCLDSAQCQKAARALVPFMRVIREKVDAEREFRSAQRKKQKEMDELAAREEKKKQQKQQKKNKKKAEKQKEKAAAKGENGVRHQEGAAQQQQHQEASLDSRASRSRVKVKATSQGTVSRVLAFVLKLVALSCVACVASLCVLSVWAPPQYGQLRQTLMTQTPLLWDAVAPRLQALGSWLHSEGVQPVLEWYRTLSDHYHQKISS